MQARWKMILFQKAILDFFLLIQTVFLGRIMLCISHIGEEFAALAVLAFVYWCVNKKKGFSSMMAVLISGTLGAVMKGAVRFPGPYAEYSKYSGFIINYKTGYSFPCTRTLVSVSLFGSLARQFDKNKPVKVISIVLCVLIPLTALYFTASWPLDIASGVMVGLFGCLAICTFASELYDSGKFAGLMIFGAVLTASGAVHAFLIDKEVLPVTVFAGSYAVLALFGSAMMGFCLDSVTIEFKTAGVRWKRLIRYIFGVAGLYIILRGFGLPATPMFSLLRSVVAGMWITLLWPALGRKIRLFR